MTVCTPETVRLTKQQARRLTDSIKRDLESLWVKIVEAWLGDAHIALGYESWQAYCSTEFNTDYLKIPAHERMQAIAMLREHGMSVDAMEAAGVGSNSTIKRHLKVLNQEGSINPTEIKGTDGKTYKTNTVRHPQPTASQPKPANPTRIPTADDDPWLYVVASIETALQTRNSQPNQAYKNKLIRLINQAQAALEAMQ